MDSRTEQILKIFQVHSRTRTLLTALCYFFIVSGLFVYVFHAFNQGRNAKLILKYKEEAKDFKTEKTMTNPRINFLYKDGEIYHIKAEKAFHKDNQSAILYNVSANGPLGNITAGELQISEEGDRLIFSKNPVVILNKTSNK